MDKIGKKVVVVGDAGCGKTSLLIVSSTNKYLNESPPSKVEHVAVDIEMGRNEVELFLYNTAGEKFGRLARYYGGDNMVITY